MTFIRQIPPYLDYPLLHFGVDVRNDVIEFYPDFLDSIYSEIRSAGGEKWIRHIATVIQPILVYPQKHQGIAYLSNFGPLQALTLCHHKTPNVIMTLFTGAQSNMAGYTLTLQTEKETQVPLADHGITILNAYVQDKLHRYYTDRYQSNYLQLTLKQLLGEMAFTQGGRIYATKIKQ